MNSTVSTPPLRPLGLGELLDRAVTLCVTHFVPLALIYVAYGIPLAFVSYFASRRNSMLVQAMTDAVRGKISGAATSPTEVNPFLGGSSPNDVVWSLALLALFFFVAPLASAALIEATSAIYAGRAVTFSQAYRAGLGRWLPLIGVNLLFGLAIVALYIAVSIVTVVIGLAVFALFSAVHVLGIVVGAVLGLAFLVALILFGLVVLLMLQMAYFTCVIESAGPVTAFSRGFGRIANRIGFRRAVAVGLAYFAVSIGIFIVGAIGQTTLVGLLHSRILGIVFAAIIGIVTAAFLTAFMTIFYYDLRVREEGLDLELAARASFALPVEGA